MENERFELQNVAIPLKWQLPAPKCCKLQGKWIKQQIQNKTKRINTILKKKIRTHMAKWIKMAKAWIRIIKPMTIIPCLEIGWPVILMWSTGLQVNYISMSAWTDRSSFDKWWSSKSFANMAQASAGMFGPLDHWTIGSQTLEDPTGGADGCPGGGPVLPNARFRESSWKVYLGSNANLYTSLLAHESKNWGDCSLLLRGGVSCLKFRPGRDDAKSLLEETARALRCSVVEI